MILIGCEESQVICKAYRRRGIEAFSCDLVPCSGGHPEWHIIADVLIVMRGGVFTTQAGTVVKVERWSLGIFHPPCTYLTCSAEWAYGDGPYHQKVKEGTLVGAARRWAREEALGFVCALMNAPIDRIAVENPIGVIGSRIFKVVSIGERDRWEVSPKTIKGVRASQIVQPYEFGDDASKATALYLQGLPLLKPTRYVSPRIVNGKERWGNQTDTGQNRLGPSEDRAKKRSETFPGIGDAISIQWDF